VRQAAWVELPSSGPPAVASPSSSTPVASGPVVGDKNFPMPAPGTCKLGERDGQPVPDPQCTPGAIDAAVTEANLTATICKSDWREKAYPAVEVDTRMKANSARAYGLPPDYEGEYTTLSRGCSAALRKIHATGGPNHKLSPAPKIG
jgi:hypothetical protein